MPLQDFANVILFVIVLYKRRPWHAEAYTSFQRLRAMFPGLSLLLYDNSPEPSDCHDQHVLYRHDRENKGVARAYNEAHTVALAQQKRWMMLFDQDTAFDIALLDNLHRSVVQHPESVCFVPMLGDSAGLFSPFRWNAGRGRRIQQAPGKLLLRKYRFANSGLLINIEAYQRAGGYDEHIPLDFSDISFGEKLSMVTDHFIVAPISLVHDSSVTKQIALADAIERFPWYCLGAFQMGKRYGPLVRCYFWALLRSVQLSIRYRSGIFLKIFLTVT